MDKVRPSLQEYVKNSGRACDVALEVGVCAGDNAAVMLEKLQPRRIYLVDNWHTQYNPKVMEWMATCCKRFENDNRVIIIKANSMWADELIQPESVDYLYIDGAHDYDSVLADIRAWWKVLEPNGVLSGHDFNHQGVHDAVLKVFGARHHRVWLTADYNRSPSWFIHKQQERKQ